MFRSRWHGLRYVLAWVTAAWIVGALLAYLVK